MLCFLMFSSAQLHITVLIGKTQGTTINLSCIKSYFTLSGGSRCCYRQMFKIIVCWKVISCCVAHKFLQNLGTLSNKRHHITSGHITSHMLQDGNQITPTPEYIIYEKMNKHNGHSGVFLTEQTWFTNK